MREHLMSLFAPCRLGWLALASALVAYGITTQQWTVLLAGLAPAVGLLAGLLVNRGAGSCDDRAARRCTGTSDD